MKLKSASLLALLILAFAQEAHSCTIPVFRYALDRWPADPYGLAVNDQWVRSDAGEAFMKELGDLAYRFQLVPADKAPGQIDLLLPAAGSVSIWSGKADARNLKEIATSPARKEVAAGILAGNSAVWVVVRSGNRHADQEFESRLSKRLEYLQSVAAIPPQDPFDPESRLGPGPELRVGFKMVIVDRNAPTEAMFIKMLLGPDGAELLSSGVPFAGPVFGRGRVLGVFTEEQLDNEGIDELTLFLLGACSCQVKAQNPGWDLLLDTDWDAELTRITMAAERETASKLTDMKTLQVSEPKAQTPEMVVFSGPVKESEKPAKNSPKPARELVLGLGLLTLIGIWLGWKSGN